MPNTRPDNLPLAIFAILLTVLALSFGDATFKLFNADLSVWQIFTLRSTLVLPILFILAKRAKALRTHAPFWVALRTTLMLGVWLSYYIGLPYLSLPVAAAVMYTIPLFITLFSATLNREPVGKLGWLAVCVGFVGVLLVLRPTSDAFNSYAIFPLMAALCYASAMVLTRAKCNDEHTLTIALNLNIGFVLLGLIGSLAAAFFPVPNSPLGMPWASLDATAWGVITVMALAIFTGSIGTAYAYKNAPSSVIGTFDFAYVGFAMIWGILFFSDIPDALSLVGIALIVFAGIISVRR